MPLLKEWRYTLLFSIFIGLVSFIFIRTISIQDFENSDLPMRTQQVGKLKWELNLNDVKDGYYYLSLGRPIGPCSLRVNGELISTNKSIYPELRKSIMLGAGLELNRNMSRRIVDLECESEPGFATALSHKPFLSSYRVGMLVHCWRTLTELVIGPMCSLILIIYLLSSRYKLKMANYGPYLTFSIVILIYTLSLAHFSRLFMTGLPAAILHTCLRTTLCYVFYRLCAFYSKKRWQVDLSCFLAISGLIAVGVCVPKQFDSFYNSIYPLYSLIMLVSIFDLSKAKSQTKTSFYLREIGVIWLFVLLGDLATIYSNFGSYRAHILSPLIVTLLLTLRVNSDLLDKNIEAITSKIWIILENRLSVDKKLSDLTTLCHSIFAFPKCSAYVDAYVIGMHDVPFKKYIRIVSSSADVISDRKKTVNFDDGYGNYMREVIENGNPQLNLGTSDGQWFLNIPIGAHAVLNFTGLPEKLQVEAKENLEMSLRIHPAIKALNHQLSEFASRMAFDLEALRLIKGDGIWDEEVGMIFIDINFYSDNCEKFHDPYARFVSQVYLPALCQRVRKWAVREGATEGDSAYLLCIKELMQEDCSVSQAVYNTVAEIMKFVQLEGESICRSQGYDPIQIQIGASAGVVTVICDTFQVRTSGNLVNEAARLQQGAPTGGTIVHRDLVAKWPSNGILSFSSEKNELVKTKRLKSRQVYLNIKSFNAA